MRNYSQENQLSEQKTFKSSQTSLVWLITIYQFYFWKYKSKQIESKVQCTNPTMTAIRTFKYLDANHLLFISYPVVTIPHKIRWMSTYTTTKIWDIQKPNSCSSRTPMKRRLNMFASTWKTPACNHMQVIRRHHSSPWTTLFTRRAPILSRLHE